ncbi:MAG TPA: ABC transporter substrate-binding protein [Candidatus Limnocylindria bacterium]|jgi:peptide/nickel transport system substrate-binding protein|nr:ABC transporter substrate-binding protein [Candidatus Limnocylindria bacterium]
MLMRLAFAAVLALSACQVAPVPGVATPTPTPVGSADVGGSFRVALTADAATLDPWNANDTNTLLVTRQIFETLVDYEPGGFKIVPKLAEAWSVSSDGRSWTFALRRGVKFHDGTDLDAASVVLNLDRARQTAHPLRGAAGADRYRAYAALLEGFDDTSVIARVEAKDGATVVITTKMPFGPLLADLATPSFAIVSPRSMRDDPAGWSTPASSGASGTGPFVFRPGAWQSGQQIALERNGAYWAKDRDGTLLPYVDRVVFRVIKDETARIAELRSGGLDVVRDLTAASLPTVKADPNLQLLTRPAFNATYLGITGAVKPFEKVEVRRAIAMAVDRSLLTAALYGGAGRPASQLLAPGMLGYDDSVVDFYRYDTAAAKRLLADAAYPSGFATDLWYPTAWRAQYPDPRRVAETIAADLAKIGIVVTLRTEDAAAYRADARAERLPLWLDDAGGDSADPDSFFSDGGVWAGDVVRELLRRARYEADASKRTELYKQTSKLIQQDAARIPLVHTDVLVAATKKVRGLVPHPIGVESYGQVWLGR